MRKGKMKMRGAVICAASTAALSFLTASTGRAEMLPAEIAPIVRELAPGSTVKRVRTRDRDGVDIHRIDLEFPDGRDGRIEITSQGEVRELKIELDAEGLPEAVRAAARRLYADAEFDEAKHVAKDGRTVYEVKFKKDGRDLEASLDAEGRLVERNDELDPASLPAAVRDRLAEEHPGAHVTEAVRRFEDGRDFVEVRIRRHVKLTLPHPEGTRADMRRVSADELPPTVREAAEKALGRDVTRLRFVEKRTAPVTVYEVEVRREEDIEIDLEGAADERKPVKAGAEPVVF